MNFPQTTTTSILKNNFSIINLLALAILFFCFASVKGDSISPEIPFMDHPGFINGGKHLDFNIFDENDIETTLQKLKGNVVVVIISATWCSNCPDVLKSVDALKKKIKDEKVENIKILALNVGDETLEEIKTHYISIGVEHLDVYKSVPASIMDKIYGVPACVIFDTSGNPLCGYLGGGIDFSSDVFIDYLKYQSKK